MFDVELVVIDPVEEHIHTRQVVGGQVDLLSQEAIPNDMLTEESSGLQEERTRATRGVIDLINRLLTMDSKLSDQLRHLLRGEELPARLPCISSIVRDQKLISIPKEIDLTIFKGPKVKLSHSLHHSTQATILLWHIIP